MPAISVFVSTEDSADDRVAAVIALLRARRELSIECSPLKFDTAWRRFAGAPRPGLFRSRASAKALPPGFRRYEDASVILPVEPAAAVAAFLAAIGR